VIPVAGLVEEDLVGGECRERDGHRNLAPPARQVEARRRTTECHVRTEGTGVHLVPASGHGGSDTCHQPGQTGRFLDQPDPEHPRPRSSGEAAETANPERERLLSRSGFTDRVEETIHPIESQLGEEMERDMGGGAVDPAHPGDPPLEFLDVRGEQPVRGRSDGDGEEGSQGRRLEDRKAGIGLSVPAVVAAPDSGGPRPERTLYTSGPERCPEGRLLPSPSRSCQGMNSMRQRIAGVVATATAAALTVACGSAGLASETPAQIYHAAASATDHVSGYEAAGEVAVAGSTVTFDFEVHGADFAGSFVLDGSTIRVLAVRGTFYVDAPEAALQADFGISSVEALLLANRWVEVPSSESSDFADLTSVTDIAAQLAHHGTLTAGGTSTIDGQRVVLVKDGTDSVLAVATSGPAYPVRITATGSGAGHADFSNWNSIAAVTPPPSPIILPGS